MPKVVYGCENDRFGGMGTVVDVRTQGMLLFSSIHCLFTTFAGEEGDVWQVDVQKLVRADEAIDMLKRFYTQTNPNAPAPKDKSRRIKE